MRPSTLDGDRPERRALARTVLAFARALGLVLGKYRPGTLACVLACACGRSDLLLDDEPLVADGGGRAVPSSSDAAGGASSGATDGSSSSASEASSGASADSGAHEASSSGSGSSGASASGSSSSSSSSSSGGDIFQEGDGVPDDGGGGGGGDGSICGPATCAGCCQDGVCMFGRINYACGAGGVACVYCDVQKNCGPTAMCN